MPAGAKGVTCPGLAFHTKGTTPKSKFESLNMPSGTPPRRFRVEPVETTVRSSKTTPREAREAQEEHQMTSKSSSSPNEASGKLVGDGSQQERSNDTKLKPRAIRRFAAEPVETTTRSSKTKGQEEQSKSPKPARRFAPLPIETTTKSNRGVARPPLASITTSPRESSRKKFADEWDQETVLSPKKFKAEPSEGWSIRPYKSAKRFTPQLMETAHRSRKAGDVAPTLRPSDQTEATTEEIISPRQARLLGVPPTPPTNTPIAELSQNPLFLEIQQRACPLARRRSYFSCSQHSFRVPDLDPIESSESEPSAPSSPTTSPSVTSDHSFVFKDITRQRESVDGRSAGYLLELAAKAAERQLREQALAAFPNNHFHEPVDHFIDCDREGSISSVNEAQGKRESSTSEVNWELEAMRKYQGQQEKRGGKQKRDGLWSKQKESSKQAANHSTTPGGFLDATMAKRFAHGPRDPELERMRKSARPPMLGKDIKFPRCSSPEPARFDSTQGCDAVKTAMCYISEQTKAACEKGESLWCGKGNGRQTSNTPSLWSTANSRASSTHGLWGGYCMNGGENSPRGPSGILTPHNEKVIPASPCPTPAMSLLPPTPPASASASTWTADFSSIDQKLAFEQSITEDFSDDFITQVYNYLSLGYPSMARPFDDELSKISKISVYELRQDDHLAESRGYIRLGKDGNLIDSKITEESCMRWRALRVYVQEWARQHPGMAQDDMLGAGTTARKGSWAL